MSVRWEVVNQLVEHGADLPFVDFPTTEEIDFAAVLLRWRIMTMEREMQFVEDLLVSIFERQMGQL